jgi:hypothetical protein
MNFCMDDKVLANIQFYENNITSNTDGRVSTTGHIRDTL